MHFVDFLENALFMNFGNINLSSLLDDLSMDETAIASFQETIE